MVSPSTWNLPWELTSYTTRPEAPLVEISVPWMDTVASRWVDAAATRMPWFPELSILELLMTAFRWVEPKKGVPK